MTSIFNIDVEMFEKSMEEFVRNMQKEQEHIDRWINKLKVKYENNLDFIIEKLMDKYYSDEYIDREHKIGVQPREPLLWLVWEYAQHYGKDCNDERYFNDFTGAAYYIGSYVIQIMYGQGSTLKIDKNFDYNSN